MSGRDDWLTRLDRWMSTPGRSYAGWVFAMVFSAAVWAIGVALWLWLIKAVPQ